MNPEAVVAGLLLLPVCLVALVEATLPAPGSWMYVYQWVAAFVYLLRFPMLVWSVGLAGRGLFVTRSTSMRAVYTILIAATIAVNLYLNAKFRG